MPDPRYPSARDVAPAIQAHFAKMRTVASTPAGHPALAPPLVDDIEALLDTAFWASLRREENYLPRISLALLPSGQAQQPVLFATPLPFAPVGLVRVAPAVERRGIHLGVWRDASGTLKVWGTTRVVPANCLVVEVSGPGLLVIKHHRGDGGKYVNVAVLEADRVLMVDDGALRTPDCPAFVGSLLGADVQGWEASAGVLVELAVSMRAHGRGGMMLMVPAGSDAWRESIVQPMSYAISPQFNGLADLVRRAALERHAREWQDEMEDAVAALAGLTAVDGATVATDRYELLAFGAKIARRRGSSFVEQVSLTEPIVGGEAAVVHPSAMGGTRHLSAAQFVHDQHDAVALVASQDGRFTIFSWSPCDERVQARRIETLLL